MDNLPSLPDDNFREFNLIPGDKLPWTPDPNFDYDDVKGKFDTEIPFYVKTDYIVAAACGMLTSALDIVVSKDNSIANAHEWGQEKVSEFVIKVAKKLGYKGDDLNGAVKFMEKFHLASDSVTDKLGGATQHHLRDFAHHPTIVGLIFSLLTQFTGKAFGTNTAGVFIIVPVTNDKVIGKTIPEKLLFGTVYWVFHMISDMAGSSGSIGKRSGGTGIPGPLLSFMKEVSALPFFQALKDENGVSLFSKWLSKLFNGTIIEDGVRFDLRTELGLIYDQAIHSLSVILNEILVRGYFMVSRICYEISSKNIKSIKQLDKIDIKNIIPIKQRRLTRMLTISSGCFFAVTTSYTVIKNVVAESYLNILLELNYGGIIRFAFAIKADAKYIIEDHKILYEEIQRRNIQRDRFNAKQTVGLSYFALTEPQALLLESLKNQKVEYDISQSKNKETKRLWQTQWTAQSDQLSAGRLISDETHLYLAIHDEMKQSKNQAWFELVVMELSRFTPYYPIGQTEDVKTDKKYRSIHLQSNYEYDVFTVMQNYVDRMKYKELTDSIKHYENVLNETQKKIATGVATTLVLTAATGGLAMINAPTIAVALAGNSFTGLYGVALTNASLAAIGGGALASGGLGMSGGIAMITGGGALLSFLGSGSASAASIKFLSNKGNVITECANILTYCNVVIKDLDNRTEILNDICSYLENNLNECEGDIAAMKASTSKEKDTKLIKQAETNTKYIKKTINEIKKLMG